MDGSNIMGDITGHVRAGGQCPVRGGAMMRGQSVGLAGKERLARRKYGPCVAGKIRRPDTDESCLETGVVVLAPHPERRWKWRWKWQG